MLRYKEKVVVIIGGTSGMGLETARFFHDEGARVIATGHGGDAVAAATKTLGDSVAVLASNATEAADRERLAHRIARDFGRIDLLFVNAGATAVTPASDVSVDEYDQLMGLNARAAFFLVQELSPLISEGGAIVATTSVANVKGIAGNSVYAATKAALRSFVRTWARELAPRNIRVNAVSPGPISTSILDKVMSKEAADKARAVMRENNPMKRFGTPEEIARAVAFLGFEATFTTGAELPVDGGASQL